MQDIGAKLQSDGAAARHGLKSNTAAGSRLRRLGGAAWQFVPAICNRRLA